MIINKGSTYVITVKTIVNGKKLWLVKTLKNWYFLLNCYQHLRKISGKNQGKRASLRPHLLSSV